MSDPSNVNTDPSEENVVDELAPHVSLPEATAQLPLLLFKVKPSSDAVAVKVAQVPVEYQVPLEMMQPFLLPFVTTFR